MATVDEVTRAFLGVGKPLPQATRSGVTKAYVTDLGCSILTFSGSVVAMRAGEYVQIVRLTHTGELRNKLNALILHLRDNGHAIAVRDGWGVADPDKGPSEFMVPWMSRTSEGDD